MDNEYINDNHNKNQKIDNNDTQFYRSLILSERISHIFIETRDKIKKHLKYISNNPEDMRWDYTLWDNIYKWINKEIAKKWFGVKNKNRLMFIFTITKGDLLTWEFYSQYWDDHFNNKITKLLKITDCIDIVGYCKTDKKRFKEFWDKISIIINRSKYKSINFIPNSYKVKKLNEIQINQIGEKPYKINNEDTDKILLIISYFENKNIETNFWFHFIETPSASDLIQIIIQLKRSDVEFFKWIINAEFRPFEEEMIIFKDSNIYFNQCKIIDVDDKLSADGIWKIVSICYEYKFAPEKICFSLGNNMRIFNGFYLITFGRKLNYLFSGIFLLLIDTQYLLRMIIYNKYKNGLLNRREILMKRIKFKMLEKFLYKSLIQLIAKEPIFKILKTITNFDFIYLLNYDFGLSRLIEWRFDPISANKIMMSVKNNKMGIYFNRLKEYQYNSNVNWLSYIFIYLIQNNLILSFVKYQHYKNNIETILYSVIKSLIWILNEFIQSKIDQNDAKPLNNYKRYSKIIKSLIDIILEQQYAIRLFIKL